MSTLASAMHRLIPALLAPTIRQIEESQVGSRLARGVFWSVLGAILPRFLTIAASMLVARTLGHEQFGELGIIQSTVSMFSTFAGFGLGLTATKYVAEYKLKAPEKAGRILGLSELVVAFFGILVAVILMVLAPVIAEKTLSAPKLADLLRIGALLIALSALTGAQIGALAGFEAFKSLAQINLYTSLATFLLLVFGSMFFGVAGAVWGLIGASAVNWFLNRAAIRREGRIAGISVSVRDCLKEWKVLLRFSLPAVLSGMLAAPVNWLCNTILVNQTSGYSEMGIVSVTNQWFFVLLLFPGILVRSTMPILTERLAHNDNHGCKELLRYSVKLNAVLVLPVVLLGCFASKYLMGLYGKEFQNAWLALVISIATSGVLAIQIPIGMMTAATGRMWLEIVMNLAWAGIFYFGTWLLSPWGALGLVTARLVAYVVHTLWTTAFAVWVLKASDSGCTRFFRSF